MERTLVSKCLLLDLKNVESDIFTKPQDIEQLVLEISENMGCTVEKIISHEYHPQGITVTCIISESSITVHTWPEHKYVQIDINSCRMFDTSEVVLSILEKVESSVEADYHEIKRYL